MDQVVRLQRGRPRLTTSAPATDLAAAGAAAEEEEEEDDDDVADLYTYIPRRRGDFPPVGYEQPNKSPLTIQYDIVDREFEDDIPVYIVRTHKDVREQRLVDIVPSEVIGEALIADEGRQDLDRDRKTRSSSRQTPVSATSNPQNEPLAYDPDDPTIVRVDLFNIHDYVSPRELERFETYRFEHPRPEDDPVRIPSSRASSVMERAERALHRGEMRTIVPSSKSKGKPGRPPKKKSKFGPMVVIQGSSGISKSSSNHPAFSSREESVEPLDVDLDATEEELVQPSIEDVEDVDMQDMSTSLRGAGSLAQSQINRKSTQIGPEPRSSRSVTQVEYPRASEVRVTRESHEHKPLVRRARPSPQTTNSTRSQPPKFATSRTSNTNGHSAGTTAPSGTSTSHTTSKSNTQATIDSYLKAMSAVNAANAPPNAALLHRLPSKQIQQSAKASGRPESLTKTNGKQRTSRSHSVQPVTHDIVISPTGDEFDIQEDDEEYEISHIILHDESRNERYYLVAWKGYNIEDATWLTEGELEGAQDALQEYLQSLTNRMMD